MTSLLCKSQVRVIIRKLYFRFCSKFDEFSKYHASLISREIVTSPLALAHLFPPFYFAFTPSLSQWTRMCFSETVRMRKNTRRSMWHDDTAFVSCYLQKQLFHGRLFSFVVVEQTKSIPVIFGCWGSYLQDT